MNKIYTLLLFLSVTVIANHVNAQVPTCGTDVPYFQVDLTGQPEGIWISPSHNRVGNCCGTCSPDRCTSFEIILDPNAAMINFEIASGAIPTGSMFYQIDCGPQVAVGNPICIAGVGPHYLTFCKPGNNENTYRVTSIAKPTFPDDDSTRIGCSLPVSIYGLSNITINSISPGTPGQYNSYLSCTDCATPDFSPGLGAPAFIDYEICGTPIASACGYIYTCDTVRLYAFQPLGGSVSPNPASFCDGGGGVLLTASSSGGDGNYSFEWVDGSSVVVSTGSTYNATTQENFTVAINDGLSSATCPASYITVPVTVGQPAVVDAGTAQTVCANDPLIYLNGSVSNATGAVWSGGAGVFSPNDSTTFASYTPTTSEIDAGFVTLTLTSYGAGGGCVDAFDQVTITFSDTTDIAFTLPVLPCHNSTGIISTSVSNGTAPYTYLWSNGSGATSITVGAGSYWLDVTDAIGCIHQENVTVIAPAALDIFFSTTDVSVDGGSDGTATAIVSGGTPPYTYSWSNGDVTSTAINLSYGIVTVTVTDDNGCTISGSTVVNEPRCNGYIASASAVDVSCFGGNDGSASASISGGTGPYTFTWNTSPVSIGTSVSGLVAGAYTVEVVDANVCIDLVTVIVAEPDLLTNSMTHVDIPVIGDNTGSATANPVGGTPGYTYTWSPGGEITQSITNLFAGTYYVDIEDANLCAISDSVIINEPPCNNFDLGVILNHVSCNGFSDGSARVVIAHGVAPYTITWSNGQTGIMATNLVAGSYSVTVTDASNCTTFENFDITEPSVLSLGLTPTSISCFGANDGTIDLTAAGGTYPYSYVWLTGVTPVGFAEDLVNLKPGTYSVTVTDAQGCTAIGSTGITQPTQLAVSSVKVNTTCNESTDGSINATVSGGTSPYTYSWSGPGSYAASSEDISGLESGVYSLTVTDQNNCNLSAPHEVYIDRPDTVVIHNILVDCPVAGGSSANVTVDSITGGAETTYSISFDNGTTFLGYGIYTTALPINATYQVLAQDQNGCETFIAYTLNIDAGVTVDTVIFDPCIPAGATDISVTATPLGGDGGPYEVSSDNGSTFNTPGVLTFNLAVGNSYNMVVKDSKGCLSLPYSIVIPNELIASAVIQNEVSCLGESDGSINLTVTGGTTPYAYSWIGPSGFTASTEDLSGLIEGNYSVTVTDDNGCTDNTSVLLTTIVDVTLPTITCPADINVNNDPGFCGAIVNYLAPVGVDNCPLGTNTILTAGLASGSFFPVGTTTVEYTVTDSAGNSASCSFDVVVTDNENPTITCPIDVAVNSDAGLCEATTVLLGTPTTNDNCGVATVTNDAPATFAVGTTTVTWTVTDVNGNSITCTQDVVVTDNENPTITCPADVAVDSDAGLCEATTVSLGTPTTNDNCGVATVTNDAPATFVVGTTTVTWTVTDVNGNSITCTQDVVVTDNENPTITCPADVAVNSDAGLCEATTVLLGTPTTNDNCGVATVTNDAPATFAVGTTTVTWTVTDVNGNSITCTQDVVVTDNENPTITCPADVAVDSDAGLCEATTVSLGTPTTNDNCGVATVTNDAPATFAVGTTTVTWTVTDVNGNSITCTQDVVVTDNENPTITCPADVAVDSDAGLCEATTVSLGTPTTNDNCGVATVTNDAPATFPVGTTTVTWTVTDVNGNSATCTQDVVVTDNENPTITCPADVAVDSDAGLCEATTVLLGTPTTNDNCGVATVTNDAPATFAVGTTTVTWTVTDVNGNSATCTQDVVVTDNENPTITCPADVAVDSDAGLCEATTVSLGTPTTNDNCGVATVINDAPATFPVGTTTVTWTVTDVNGNSATCTQDVVVTDNENPTITCPADVAVNSDAGLCEATTVSLGTPTTNDNCGVATVTNDAPATFVVGTTTVTWTVTDVNGNSATCTQDVVVTDNESPVMTFCPSDISTCFPEVFYNQPTATDNCGVASVIQTAGLGSGSIFPIGTTTEVYEITDINGNVTICSFDVVIYPTPVAGFIATNVTCFGAADGTIDLTVTDGTAPFTFVWSNGEITEDLANLSPGIYDVVVTDLNGCETTTGFAISQPDTLGVTESHINVSCYDLNDGSITILPVGGSAPYTYSWSNGSSDQNLTNLAAGIYDLTLTDDNGCIYQLTVNITQPDSLYATSTTIDATCLSTNGTLDLTVYGGTIPYTYSWSNGATTQDLNDVTYGNYEVTVTDANGCQLIYSDSILYTNPVSINANIEDALCYGDRNGLIDVTVINAVEPINYYWSTGDSTSILLNIPAGDYTLTVIDSNQCTLTVTYTIEQPDSLYVILSSPTLTGGYNVSTYLGTDGSVETEVTGGTSPYEFLWTNGATTQDLYDLSAGLYAVIVTDENGCAVQASIMLTQPWELEMPSGYSPNDDGDNDFFVVHGIEVFPDNEIIIYNRWGNEVYSATGYQNEWNGYNNSGEELPDGTYFVILKIAGLDEPLTGYVDLRRSR